MYTDPISATLWPGPGHRRFTTALKTALLLVVLAPLTAAPTRVSAKTVALGKRVSGAADPISGPNTATVLRGKLGHRPVRLNFGKVQAGLFSAAQNVTLTNDSSVALNISNIATTEGFRASQNCVKNLPGNGTCTISVIFAPAGPNYAKPTAINGRLSITDDAAHSPRITRLHGIAFGAVPPPPPPPFSTVRTFVTNHCNQVTSYPSGANGNAPPLGSLPAGLCFPHGTAVDSTGKIYVVNNGNNSVTVYAAGSSGNAAPAAIIAGPDTKLNNPVGVALDGVDNVYVLNCGTCLGGDNPQDSVTVFAAGSNGDVTPTAVIAGSNTGLMSSVGVALDGGGKIYVLSALGNVAVFAANSSGDVAPIATMTGGCNSGICGPSGVALDSGGNIYIANDPYESPPSVTVYAAGSSGVVTPTATIKGSNTGLDGPSAIGVAQSGDVYVANYDTTTQTASITIYPAGKSGNIPPSATITGANTGLTLAFGIVLDASDNIYAVNYVGGPSDSGSVTIFSSGSSGNVAPSAVIASDTALNGPWGIALDPAGNIYVANTAGGSNGLGSLTVYPAGSNANTAPNTTISGPSTGLNVPHGIAVGASGKVYVSNIGNNSITVYPAGSNGDTMPVATIMGPNTGLDAPYGVAVDASENIYVVNCSDCANSPDFDSVTVYPAGSYGNVTPTASITCVGGGFCGLDFPVAVAVDARGEIYVANAGSLSGVVGQLDSVTVYSAGSMGPLATISGDHTGLALPSGIALDANANIYVSNFIGWPDFLGSVTVYPAGSKGNVAAGATIGGLATQMEAPLGIAVPP